MPASSKRVAVAAAAVLLLAFAGGLGWQRKRPSSSAHVEMLASVPETARGAAEASAPATVAVPGSPEPHAGASMQSAAHDASAQPSSAANLRVPNLPASNPPAPDRPGEESSVAAAAPSFDIVRVEPSGDALLAGRSKPDAKVSLLDRGRVVAETRADAAGNFVMTPPALKPGDYALSLRGGQGAEARESEQSVFVSVPATKAQQVVVALAEPGRATALLSEPAASATKAPATASAAGAPPPPAKLAIRSVELENGSGLFASGTAPAGSDVRVYLNDSRVADVTAAGAGTWTLEVRKGLSAGRYAVRADALKPDRSVGARVEVPFEVPVALGAAQIPADRIPVAQIPADRVPTAALPAVASTTPARTGDTKPASGTTARAPRDSGPVSAAAVVDELQTELVNRGDNLWRISRKRLGHGTRYTEIYAANLAQIRDPKLVYPGQVFVLPRD